jgi:outer membrane immunogenic protein
VFGGFAGVQKQWGSWVLGVEASFDGADIKGSTAASTTQTFCEDECYYKVTVNKNQTIDSKIDELGFVGGKIGWAWSPNWMIYGTGGIAWAHKEDDASQSQTNHFCTYYGYCFDEEDFSASQSGGLTMFGYAAGAGLDYKWQIDPGSALVIGVKYLHYGFGSHTLTLADNTFGSDFAFSNVTKESVDVVTGRISWLFSIH